MSLSPPPLPAHIIAPTPIKLARTGLAIALLTIILSIVFVLQANDLRTKPKPDNKVKPSAMMNMLARYVIGVKLIMQDAKVWQAKSAEDLAKAVDGNVHSALDRFRAEIVISALKDRELDEKVFKDLLSKAPELREDIECAGFLANSSGGLEERREWFEKRHGWLARLPESLHMPGDIGSARVTASLLGAVSIGGFAALILGVVLLIRTLINWRRGQLPPRAHRVNQGVAPCLIEGFAIYLFTYSVIIGALHRHFDQMPDVFFYGIALVFVIIAAAWPRLRGMDRQVWRDTLGFHRGAGVFKEMRAGVVGWITGLPLLGLAAMLSLMIANKTGLNPTHPIVDELAQPGWGRWGIVALAVVWAPLTEETMFRGLLFPGLSSMSRWWSGAIVSAFVFAVIHPQGWAGVPPIMAIALTMSTLRLVRGSIIAPMTAHALNNGLVSLLMVFAM